MKYFVEKGSGYEFGIDGENIFITKSPRSAASREKPRSVRKDTKAYNAIKKFIDSQTINIVDKDYSESERDELESDAELDAEDAPGGSSEDEAGFIANLDDKQGVLLKSFDEIEKSNWMSTDYDEIIGVKINNQNFKSIGYFKDEETGKEGIAIKMPYKFYSDMKKEGVDAIPLMGIIRYLKPAAGTIDMKVFSPWQRGENAKNYYLVPWGTSSVQLFVQRVQTEEDGASTLDVAQAATEVLGAIPIPFIGAPGDLASLGLELSRPKPNYFMATIFALGAIPVLGEAILFLRAAKLIPKVAKGVPGSKAAIMMLLGITSNMSNFQKIGRVLRGKSFALMVSEAGPKFLRNIATYMGILEKHLGIKVGKKALEGFIKYFDEFVSIFKTYRNLKPIKAISYYRNILAVAARPTAYVQGELYGDIITDELNDGYYAIAELEASGNPYDDAIRIGEALVQKGADMTEEELGKLHDLINFLESERMAEFLGDPVENVVAESKSMVINESNLRAIIRQLL